jgi:hypothetical protein
MTSQLWVTVRWSWVMSSTAPCFNAAMGSRAIKSHGDFGVFPFKPNQDMLQRSRGLILHGDCSCTIDEIDSTACPVG